MFIEKKLNNPDVVFFTLKEYYFLGRPIVLDISPIFEGIIDTFLKKLEKSLISYEKLKSEQFDVLSFKGDDKDVANSFLKSNLDYAFFQIEKETDIIKIIRDKKISEIVK